MNRFVNCFLIIIITLSLCLPVWATMDSEVPLSDPGVTSKQRAMDNKLIMLSSLLELQTTLKKRMEDIRTEMEKTSSVTEKSDFAETLKKLDHQLAHAKRNFQEIATGVDFSLFSDKKSEQFAWKEELTSLVKPLIKELKNLTDRARQKSRLHEDVEKYRKMLAVARDGRKQLTMLKSEASNKELQKTLQGLFPEWKSLENQMSSKLQVARLQLEQLKEDETSFIESSSRMIKNFFKTRGLYLFIVVLVVGGILIIARLSYNFMVKVVPGFKASYRPFHIRLIDILFRGFSLLFAILGLILALYMVEDWVLLSLAILFLLGIIWTIRKTIPKIWDQVRLMLNIGDVREGERIVLYGVPWLVERIHFFSSLKNPDLEENIRLPINELLGKVSRPFKKGESWFPCRKNDWVILADGTRGKAVSLSHEMVKLVMRGGAHKTYQTDNFLAQSPLNLSASFRIKEFFGLSYDLQDGVTNVMLTTLKSFIAEKIEENGYKQSLLNLRVEFMQAGSSSLDIVVIADFNGKEAPLYNRLRRSIQRWCVDCCSANNWEIPFPQLTVHRQVPEDWEHTNYQT